MSQYNKDFKLDALAYLEDLKKKGFTYIDGERIDNVRDLCSSLGISSYSLYKWKKEIPNLDEVVLDMQYEIQREKEISDLSIDDSKEDDIERIVQEKITVIMSDYRHTMSKARELGIKNYSTISHRQLQLLVGLKWIELSGLVDMEKARRVFDYGR